MQMMQETWVRSLGQEGPLEEEMVTHPSILAGKIPWAKEPGGLQSMGSQRVGQDWVSAQTHTHTDGKQTQGQSWALIHKGQEKA